MNTVTAVEPAAATSLAGIVARSCVDDTNVVARLAPFQRTTDDAWKLLPFTVSTNDGPGAVAAVGESEPATGVGGPIKNVTALVVPPPGLGENTVTAAVPTAATSPAEMAAVRRVPLTNVVVRAAPFHRTTEDETKLVPFTVRGSAGPPAGTSLGASEPSVGRGLLTVNVAALEVPPP